MVNSLTKSDIASRGFPVLDLHLSQLATRRRKVVGAIEQVGKICSTFHYIDVFQKRIKCTQDPVTLLFAYRTPREPFRDQGLEVVSF